jgi:hypothetical protein
MLEVATIFDACCDCEHTECNGDDERAEEEEEFET